LYKELRQNLGEVFKRLAEQQESVVVEGHLQPVHVHILFSIPPKYAVSQVIGFIKGKSAIYLARVYGERWLNNNRGRVSDPAQAALSGSQRKAPGSAGGYLLHGDERKVWGDAGYQGQTEAIHEAAPKAQDMTSRRTKF
jgi:REP element-mobilizing transposase RayT